MKGTTLGFALASILLLAGNATAQDRFVDDDDVTCGGNSPCYATIGAALAAVAVDGETISVAAGTYAENFTIGRAVNLIGAGAGVTSIVSANPASEFLIRLGANVPITFSQGMVLEGFTLTGDLGGDNDLLMFRARVLDAADPIVVRNNVFDCGNDHAVKGIESRSGGNLSNAVIEGNRFINECRYAMFLNSAINWVIRDNEFRNTWTGGLLINTSAVNQTHDIAIVDNEFDGVSLRPDVGSFLPNQFLAAVGLSSTVFNVEVSRNRIVNSGGHSTTIGNRTNVDLSNVVISCNDMESNFAGALNELPSNVIPAEANWWGDASGPFNAGSNPGGLGDDVTDGYDFDPFLKAPFGPRCPELCEPAPGKVTGGGQIPIGSGRANFGFVAKRKREGDLASGHFNYVNHETGLHVNGPVDELEFCEDGSVRFTGTCGGGTGPCSFTVTVEDLGEPGRDVDRFAVEVVGDVAESQDETIDKGNIQVHGQ